MNDQNQKEIKVGIFVSLGTLLLMLAITLLGGIESIFSPVSKYHGLFTDVSGMLPGAKVVIGGMNVGTVNQIDYDYKSKKILVDFNIKDSYSTQIREGSRIEILTQGVLGDKYISITVGDFNRPALPEGSEIPVTSGGGIEGFLTEGGELLGSLKRIAGGIEKLIYSFEQDNRHITFFEGMAKTAKNLGEFSKKLNEQMTEMHLSDSFKSLNSILEKIDRGKGTVGALINDKTLYDDALSLLGEANRNRVMRNLIRQTIETERQAKKSLPK
ncbi:MAG: hypothetical protein CL678_13415 [Bdellovibrionaceae bacterium]|nr:hypothetical protein [Pseudobdellovibrionaceae bacterium]|tara:strand:+ start:3686 stop:4498 length:813 start_codon:yes stop_codon:yes gene_type:complete